MARIRTIKPEIWSDPDFVERSSNARLLFIAALSFASDYGVMPDKPLQLKMQCFPGDNVDIDALVAELVDANLWSRRVAPDGAQVLIIRSFTRHQRVDRPNPGRWGNPAEWENEPDSTNVPDPHNEPSTTIRRPFDEHSSNVRRAFDDGREKEGKGYISTYTTCNPKRDPAPDGEGWVKQVEAAEAVNEATGSRAKPTLDELAAVRDLLADGWTAATLETKAVELAAKATKNPRRYVWQSLPRCEKPPPPPTRRCPDCKGDTDMTPAGVVHVECGTCSSTGKIPLYDEATA